MRRIMLVLSVLGALTASVLVATPNVAATPAPVAASPVGDEYNEAVNGTDPNLGSDYCQDKAAVKVCFERYGDRIWVWDKTADGHSVEAYWENHVRDSSGFWHLYRWGRCVDRLGSAAGWTYCNKDFYENDSLNTFNGHGSGLRLWACVLDLGCPSGYKWVVNNA